MLKPLIEKLRRPRSRLSGSSQGPERDRSPTPSKPRSPSPPQERYGLFSLGEGKPHKAGKESYDVNVVAIHGLNGNAFTTWEHKDGVLWLRDLLSDDLPGSRIFTYGYPSELFFSKSTARLRDYARGLLAALRDAFEEDAQRPIIFVCHSLGGIVCKQAIILAHEESHWYGDILAATIAIIFLGTPHRGARGTTDIGKVVGGIINASQHLSLTAGLGVTRTDLLETLSSNSIALKDLATSFRNRIEDIDIVTFHETQSTPPFSYKIVDEDSAIMDVPGEQIIPLNENHVTMCRFPGRTAGYDRVCKMIQRLARNSKRRRRSGTVQSSLRSLTETERSCLRLFNAIDFGDYKATMPRPADGTCSWILSSPQYKSWIADDKTTLLWITGAPGYGKTLLSAYLADHLSTCLRDQSRAQVCFFFCDDTITTQRDAKAILRCIVYQILQRHRSLVKHIKPRYDIDGTAIAHSFQALWEIFLKIAGDARFSTINVIVDAIDECEDETRNLFLNAVARLVHSAQVTNHGATNSIRFIITSRPYLVEINNLNGVAKARLLLEENRGSINDDVRTVIRHRVEQIVQKSQSSGEMKAFLEEALYSRSEQTFLWVDIVLRHLEGSLMASKKDFEQIINAFPLDLEATYNSFLQRIPNQYKPQTAKILRLLVGSSRHLDLIEIDLAFSIERNQRTIASLDENRQLSIKRTLHGLVGPLVRVTDSKVSFIHQTVKEFLTNLGHFSNDGPARYYGVGAAEAALTMAYACILYLSLEDFEADHFSGEGESSEHASPDTPTLLWETQTRPDTLEDDSIFKDTHTRDAEICVSLGQRYPFFDYAATHWGEHLSACQHIAPLHVQEAVAKLTKRKSHTLNNWLKYFWFKKDMMYSFPEHFDEIIVTAMFDLSILLEQHLQAEESKDQSTKDIALFWAARMGCAKSTQVLLQHGADANCRGPGQRQPPLTVAAQHGHLAVIRALLDDKRTDVNIKGDSGRSALSLAAGNGQGDIVQALITHQDYDRSDSDSSHYKPLFWAIGGNHIDIMIDLLQDNPEQINHVDKVGRTAISWAAGDGLLKPLKTLLKQPGSDANLKDNAGRSPLIWAAANGQTEVVSFLMRHNVVDTSSTDENGRNAISWACEKGHRDTVRTLIKYRCPGVDQADVDGWTPLAWALSNRSLPTVETLIESGKVDINRRDSNGRSALWYAANYGYLEVVQFLLDEGADTTVIDEQGRTAVDAAMMHNYTEIAALLEAR